MAAARRPAWRETIELPSVRHWTGPFDPPLADLGGAMLSAIALANARRGKALAAQERSMISKYSFRSGIAAFALGLVVLVAACGGAADRAPVAPGGTNTQPTTSSAASPRPPQPSAPEPAATLPPQTPTATRGTGQPPPPGGPPPGSVADVPGEGLPDCGQVPAGEPCFGSPADVPGGPARLRTGACRRTMLRGRRTSHRCSPPPSAPGQTRASGFRTP